MKIGWWKKFNATVRILANNCRLFSTMEYIPWFGCGGWSYVFDCQCQWECRRTVCSHIDYGFWTIVSFEKIHIKYEERFELSHFMCVFRIRFIVKDRCTSYSSSQRSLMVMQVLLRTKYDDSEKVKHWVFCSPQMNYYKFIQNVTHWRNPNQQCEFLLHFRLGFDDF